MEETVKNFEFFIQEFVLNFDKIIEFSNYDPTLEQVFLILDYELEQLQIHDHSRHYNYLYNDCKYETYSEQDFFLPNTINNLFEMLFNSGFHDIISEFIELINDKYFIYFLIITSTNKEITNFIIHNQKLQQISYSNELFSNLLVYYLLNYQTSQENSEYNNLINYIIEYISTQQDQKLFLQIFGNLLDAYFYINHSYKANYRYIFDKLQPKFNCDFEKELQFISYKYCPNLSELLFQFFNCDFNINKIDDISKYQFNKNKKFMYQSKIFELRGFIKFLKKFFTDINLHFSTISFTLNIFIQLYSNSFYVDFEYEEICMDYNLKCSVFLKMLFNISKEELNDRNLFEQNINQSLKKIENGKLHYFQLRIYNYLKPATSSQLVSRIANSFYTRICSKMFKRHDTPIMSFDTPFYNKTIKHFSSLQPNVKKIVRQLNTDKIQSGKYYFVNENNWNMAVFYLLTHKSNIPIKINQLFLFNFEDFYSYSFEMIARLKEKDDSSGLIIHSSNADKLLFNEVKRCINYLVELPTFSEQPDKQSHIHLFVWFYIKYLSGLIYSHPELIREIHKIQKIFNTKTFSYPPDITDKQHFLRGIVLQYIFGLNESTKENLQSNLIRLSVYENILNHKQLDISKTDISKIVDFYNYLPEYTSEITDNVFNIIQSELTILKQTFGIKQLNEDNECVFYMIDYLSDQNTPFKINTELFIELFQNIIVGKIPYNGELSKYKLQFNEILLQNLIKNENFPKVYQDLYSVDDTNLIRLKRFMSLSFDIFSNKQIISFLIETIMNYNLNFGDFVFTIAGLYYVKNKNQHIISEFVFSMLWMFLSKFISEQNYSITHSQTQQSGKEFSEIFKIMNKYEIDEYSMIINTYNIVILPTKKQTPMKDNLFSEENMQFIFTEIGKSIYKITSILKNIGYKLYYNKNGYMILYLLVNIRSTDIKEMKLEQIHYFEEKECCICKEHNEQLIGICKHHPMCYECFSNVVKEDYPCICPMRCNNINNHQFKQSIFEHLFTHLNQQLTR
jgi:hypothetical protein